ncbi:MAG TPA: energy transducer TonB [Candidatus Angelobacter sp.]
MPPLISGGRAPLMKSLLTLLLCTLCLLPQAGALQTSIQLETNSGGRKIRTRIEPEYPELALKARISGTARVSLTVTAEGSVKDVKELGGSPILLAALVRAVKQWKYEPATKESEVEVKAAFVR